jgi:hypothetical protein
MGRFDQQVETYVWISLNKAEIDGKTIETRPRKDHALSATKLWLGWKFGRNFQAR